MYADDVMQIITHPSPRHQFIRLATDRAVAAINQFEEAWKIKTNKHKFTVIPAARTKPGIPNLQSIDVNFAKAGKMLGLKITNTGISSHVKERIRIAENTFTKIKRFSSCPPMVKLKLYKSMVRPALEYPPVPLNALSPLSLYKIQAVQNKAILWVNRTRWPNPRPSIRELHLTYNLEPMNT